MHPTFDPKQFGDEELMQKIIELRSRYTYAANYLGSYQAAEQLAMFLDLLEAEYTERQQKLLFEQYNKQFPDVIETDPDFKEKKDEQGKKPKQGSSGGASKEGWRQRTFRKPQVD